MWTWMRHPAIGGTNRFPTTVIEQMTALGWEPCDAPADEGVRLVAEIDQAPEATPTPAPQVDQPPAQPTTRARRGGTEE